MADKEYIEREALIESIKQIHCADCNSYNGVRCRACQIGDALDVVEDAPAADVAPVVHGEWLDHDNDYATAECSKCGELFEVSDTGERLRLLFDSFRSAYKHCPNCDAKMDGGKK